MDKKTFEYYENELKQGRIPWTEDQIKEIPITYDGRIISREKVNVVKGSFYNQKLKREEIYFDKSNKEVVEFKYLGATGYAIVCEPGDSAGGMQSSWGTDPDNLEKIVNK